MRSLLSSFFICLALMAFGQNVVVIDLDREQPLIEIKADQKRPVASLTKIATALVTLDWAVATKTPLSTFIEVPSGAAEIGGANVLDLHSGDVLQINDALKAALICSDNKAAFTLSHYIGSQIAKKGSSSKTAQKRFVSEMNRLAKELKMDKTNFRNSTGLDSAKERGKSSANDIATLCRYALKNEFFLKTVSQRKTTGQKRSKGKTYRYSLKNTNSLVGRNGVIGVKTGTTYFAGECLAVAQKKRGKTILCVILNSQNRFTQAEAYLAEAWRRSP